MKALRWSCFSAGVAIVVNDLVWLSAHNPLADCQAVAITSFVVWVAGCCAILVPWVFAQTLEGSLAVSAAVGFTAFITAVIGIRFNESPIFAPYGDMAHIVEVIWMTWSLAGGLGLAVTARWAQIPSYRALSPQEVKAAICPFAPDPAVLVALYGIEASE